MPNRGLVAGIAAVALVACGASVRAESMTPAAFMKAVNGDNDRTISKDEIDSFARKRFADLESDNDKTLDAKELKGRLSVAGMKKADPDKDATVDENEYVAYADKLFDLANRKGDKTLSMAELRTAAGKKLIELLH